MKTSNNNHQIIRDLANASYKKNRSRNILMICSITITIVVIFCIFSIMKGRIDAEYKMEVRHNGNTATTTLEFPTPEQIQAVKDLNYVNDIGSTKYFADAYAKEHGGFACAYVDDDTFKSFYLPAYTDVHGTFPTKENEVMLAVRGLEELGIQTPEIGMEIEVEQVIGTEAPQPKTFTLTGYYTEYVHPIEGPPIGYFAKAHLENQGIDSQVPTTLLIKQKDYMQGEQVENMLYRDIEMKDESQRFESYNSVNYNVIMRTIGGYDVAFTLILLILSCVFFLNYNVINIAVSRDIRNLGLLKTIGTTNRQLRRIIYLQTLRMCISGIIAGSVLSILIVSFLLPALLSKYYLNNYGISSQILEFNLLLFLVSILLAVLLAFISTLRPACKAGKMASVESARFTEENPLKKDVINSQKGNIAIMAWRNLLRNRRSNMVTIISLFLGLTAALASLLIVRGLDITNNFALLPDFKIEVAYTPTAEPYDSSYMPITEDDVDFIKSMDGITDLFIVYGAYTSLNPDNKTWKVALESEPTVRNSKTDEIDEEQLQWVRENYYTTVIIANDNYLNKLEHYVAEASLNIDMEALKSGKTAISTNGSFFSKQQLDDSKNVVGNEIEILDANKMQIGTLTFGGYLDTRRDAFPSDLHIMFKLPAPELIISESAFNQLGLTKRALRIEINVAEEKEPLIKKQLLQLMESKKSQLKPSEQDLKMPYLNINSEGLEAAADEINTTKIVMYTISILLTVLGLFNYLNATAINLIGRKRELAVMESVGMTRRQLRKLLITEGVYFSAIISGLTAALGSGILVLLFKVMHSRIRYTKFIFPYMGMSVIVVLIFIICISVPMLLYRRITNESIIDRLRE